MLLVPCFPPIVLVVLEAQPMPFFFSQRLLASNFMPVIASMMGASKL